MPLTVPDSDDLKTFMQRIDDFSAQESDWVDDALQRATDLFWLATGLEDDPEDERVARIVSNGILAMAMMILVTGGEDRENAFSPYSSERLGSYSYSKAQASVSSHADTGISEFDLAVKLFTSTLSDANVFSLTSEKVFTQPFQQDPELVGHDPVVQVFGTN